MKQAATPHSKPHTSKWPDTLAALAAALLTALLLTLTLLPLLALVLRVPLDGFFGYLTRPFVVQALWVSLLTTVATLVLAILLGTPLAFLLAHGRFRGRRLLETLVELPLVMPPAVGGVALLLAFGQRGLLGSTFKLLGIEIAFSTLAVIIAQTFIAVPFYIRSARVGFGSVPHEVEEAARVDGAGRWATFSRISVPLAGPGLLGGAVLCWARASGEFGATILFAGNYTGRTQTMPLAIYSAFEGGATLEEGIILSVILLVFSFSLLLSFKLLTEREAA